MQAEGNVRQACNCRIQSNHAAGGVVDRPKKCRGYRQDPYAYKSRGYSRHVRESNEGRHVRASIEVRHAMGVVREQYNMDITIEGPASSYLHAKVSFGTPS